MAAPLSNVDSFQYPSAHYGHLSEEQQKALDKFKQISEEQGYYHPAGKDGRKYSSHDDETLLRYLRARTFLPEEGFRQFKETEDWRKENHLIEYYDSIDINEYEATRRLYPQWTGRRDRRGIPVYLFEVQHLDSTTIANYQKALKNDKSPPINPKSKVEPKMMRLFALYENLTRFIQPLCTAVKDRPHAETPISQSNNIVDISNVGLRQFWNLKTHMQDASTLATAHYPETLDRIFIIGAPSFFPTVWSWVKRWFDPITVSKIFILSSADMKSTLEEYIAPENIPKKYGGTLDFTWGALPVLEPAIADTLDWHPTAGPDGVTTTPGAPSDKIDRSFPIGPIKWRESATGPAGRVEAVAVGKENGVVRERVLATIDNPSFLELHGVQRHATNTPVDWAKEPVRPSTGTATQPAVDGDPEYGRELAEAGSGVDTPVDAKAGTISPVPGVAGALPIREKGADGDVLSPSASQPRTGTSDTRFQQQAGTHAEGQLGKDTPQVIDYGHGDKAAVMEPTTVGQAPKDVVTDTPKEATQQGYVGQATSVVGGAVSGALAVAGNVAGAVGGAVGLGSGSTATTTTTTTAKTDADVASETKNDKSNVDISDRTVEDYLREQSGATAKPVEKK